MSQLIEALSAIAGSHQILENEPMSRHTTFRVGGPADVLFLPESEEQLLWALSIAREAGVPCVVIGNGSNLVVKDGGIRGLVIALGEGMAAIARAGETLTAWAGASLARVSAYAQASGLSGLEFASGIPGTLGGGCAMNAGAYGCQLSDVLVDARVLLDGVVRTLTVEEMQMGYRTSLPLRRGGIVISARFALTPDDPEVIAARMRELNARRRDKQPLNYPSAGSTFKRPEGYFAGALIEQAGLKGKRVGGAQVSEKHAGFIVNTGGATAADILTLIGTVQDEVADRFGVRLETEVRILGED
ncbi:MAG: UDP-N-acetylmuramate dehydrogenase [Clostridia bacterium]|nr:UDP-N-acetylmuramate dehydrogenase [Clostridia bacterium]MBQ6122282.1 UDP-N-acetylmuramate dehydrogenase [Clostridia bacterium]